MVGRKGESVVNIERRKLKADKVALQVKDLHVDMAGEEVKGVDFTIYEGEIFGIGGLAGQGKIGIPNGLMGLYEATGEVSFFGKPIKLGDPKIPLSNGMAMVSEDRKGVGLMLDESIEDNIVLTQCR